MDRPCSQRTHYRRQAAKVAKIIAEANAEAQIISDEVVPSGIIPLVSAEGLAACNCNTGDRTDIPVDRTVSNIEKTELNFVCDTPMLEPCASSSVYVVDEACAFDVDLSLNSFTHSDENEAVEDTDEWKVRLIDVDHEDDNSDIGSDNCLREQLNSWACNHNISHDSLTALLSILHPFHADLPLSAKTILRTNRYVEIKNLCGGEYYYFGLVYWFQILLSSIALEHTPNMLSLHMNIDGIPLFNSCSTSLWPILCSIKELGGKVFPVALFCGRQKPNSLDFLNDFVSELTSLQSNGFMCNGRCLKTTLEAVICDAPARAFVKQIKGHSGFNSCERCVQRGKYLGGKVTLPDLDLPSRTDASFIAMDDTGHHVGVSPLSRLSFGMVSGFPLNYMHMVCLGVTRRMMCLWMTGRHANKLSQSLVAGISDRLKSIQAFIPREFSRKPRSLLEYKMWKATELRLFLIYTGPVVLKGLVSSEVYSNFLDLSVAIRILLTPELLESHLQYSKQLLRYFVESFCKLYGEDQMVYNVHSLIHLCEDAERFGTLDHVSAFKYENFLGRLVNLVRRPYQPCSQLVRRIMEFPALINKGETNKHHHRLGFAIPHAEGPLTIRYKYCEQYKQFYMNDGCFMSSVDGDNCFDIGGKVSLVRNIFKVKEPEGEMCCVVFETFDLLEPFFNDPLDSTDVNVFFVHKLSGFHSVCSLSAVGSKYVLLPHKHGSVALKQMHLC